ncbi:MAG: sigma-70 family RNA polymerase sigma factor [Candidatus Eisenbacteria bacterium]|nr:sigma-70 family RNA polymerase sigma factor [Candidatus Eisenbacteria bacterium]
MSDDYEANLPQTPSGAPGDTGVLLRRLRDGDDVAKEQLFTRYLPILTRWAHRRLPPQGRDLRDTQDLVQDTLLRALRRIDGFEHRGEGAFLAYLRQVLVNSVRDEARRQAVRPGRSPLQSDLAGPAPDHLAAMIDDEESERLERALQRLGEEQRQAIVLRIEFGLSHAEVAAMLGKPTPEAARALVGRSLVALAREYRRG